jgi:hypothetical protein
MFYNFIDKLSGGSKILEKIKYRLYRFVAANASGPDDILIVTPSDHIIAMELYEEAIQEAIAKAANGFIVTLELFPQNLKQAMGISNAKGMTSFLSEKTKSSDGQRIYR